MKIKIGKFRDTGGKKRFDVEIGYYSHSIFALKADGIENLEEIKKIADDVNRRHGYKLVFERVEDGIFYLEVLCPSVKIDELKYELHIR